jgi:hypothetical protein
MEERLLELWLRLAVDYVPDGVILLEKAPSNGSFPTI